jgi:hypothetical protein
MPSALMVRPASEKISRQTLLHENFLPHMQKVCKRDLAVVLRPPQMELNENF